MDSLDYYPLFLVFAIAWLVPLTLSRLEIGKLPAVIVEIIMGVVIGPYVFDLVNETPYMAFLSKTGFLLLIFLAGLEINVNKIISSFPKGRIKWIDFSTNTLLVSIVIYFGSLVLSIPFAWLVSLFIPLDIVFFSMLLPTVALSITVPILKADGELKRKFGQIMLMEGAIATVMSIILISIYSGVLKNGFEVELLLFGVIFIVFIITYIAGKRLVKMRTFQKLLYRLEHAASQIKVRGTMALLFLFVIVAQAIGTELVMGAFFAGTLLSMFVIKERSALLFKLDGMSYGFFIPIFFIMVGVNLDLSALSQFQESIPFILVLIVGFFLTQIIPALIMVGIFGLKKALSGGVLLTARLGLTIAAAQIGLSLEVIDTADNAGIVAAAIITSLISPLIYRTLSKKNHEEFHNIILLGGSKSSLYLAERFKMHNLSFITLLQKEDVMPLFEKKSLPFQKLKQITTKVLDELEIRTGDLVVILTESNTLNRELTHHIHGALGHSKIITRKQSADHEMLSPESKIKLVDHDELIANHIEDIVMRPNAVDSLSTSFDVYRVEEVLVTKPSIDRKLVRDIAFPPSGSLVILRRGGEVFIPHGNTHLLIGDVMTVIGTSAALAEFRSIMEA
ncbi:cation:proton antiporter [Roseivirga sp. E12]|uniref:cation:proton antiporter domain-containing protein n=1 Tax=Roseivirga sp. E12 TaxID=2819237 RepID=UPI001ABCFAAF|nr:cation:proton antiporter [Roseivirga sp. E12]MBO3697204.1 cation:proton antiporter [Roseivirga sp. E12]